MIALRHSNNHKPPDRGPLAPAQSRDTLQEAEVRNRRAALRKRAGAQMQSQ